ncbi:endonuclease domain-containing protein [Ruminococcus sp.]|uniref:endonuclease domain-containing protein n=1 Tax=Ruminococcus sp. TaxID=41978 RepID=UPI002E81BDA4|nr:endonuclease domain-containing protein [Ruminococcus sp.]MEE3492168.1 endonuclease domain-containing protein [Ruminococcus sp.]
MARGRKGSLWERELSATPTEELYEWSEISRDQPNQVVFMDRIHNKDNLPLARTLRNNMTKEEKHLWYDFLKLYHQQYHIIFLRQKIIGNYIVDFYCPQAKLVIELDGSQHYEEDAELYDKIRTDFLNSLDIEVLRYTNRDIHTRFKEVCDDIDYHIRMRIKELQG